MRCDVCQQREATVFLTASVGQKQVNGMERSLCEQCANGYFASTPGLGSLRRLICLSDSYRSQLYDLLEVAHPEAFYDGEHYAQNRQAGEAMKGFLRGQLKKEKIEVNDDVFDMLYTDFMGSYDFYTRRNEYKGKKG